MEISAQEIIVLAKLVKDKKATIEVVGEILENDIDERGLKVTRPSHCQYTGARGEDCEYAISFDGLRSIRTTCLEQVQALTLTIGAIDSLLPSEKGKKGKAA